LRWLTRPVSGRSCGVRSRAAHSQGINGYAQPEGGAKSHIKYVEQMPIRQVRQTYAVDLLPMKCLKYTYTHIDIFSFAQVRSAFLATARPTLLDSDLFWPKKWGCSRCSSSSHFCLCLWAILTFFRPERDTRRV